MIIAIVSFTAGLNEITETYNKEVIHRKYLVELEILSGLDLTFSFSVVPYKK